MKFQNLIPMLYTEDLNGTVAFYTTVLGFKCGALSEEWGWASLHRDHVTLMLARPNEHLPFEQPRFTGSFYFKVDEIDALWQQLKDCAKICYPLEDFEYGMREFAVYDNNGYLLQFGQEIPKP